MSEATGGATRIICGFGVPGRAVAEHFDAQDWPYTVIEANAVTCDRAGKPGRTMVEGDATSEQTLRDAGIERATLLVIAIPQEQAALQIVEIARRLNPTVTIVARTHFISTGIEARRLGADVAIVEEQAVAQELVNSVREKDAKP